MDERGNTGSITSVTEEDETSSDSDTTESYTNITSSLLSSTDTDDKLTPDLNNISISKSAKQLGNSPKRRKCIAAMGQDADMKKADINGYPPPPVNDDNFLPRSESTGFIFPYGSSPLPLGKLDDASVCSPLDEEFPRHEKKFLSVRSSSTVCDKSSGAENSEDKSSTHSSDNHSNNDKGDNLTGRPYLPDWTCATWYHARCFDHYWKHYNFVMAWYRQHVSSIRMLHNHMGMTWPGFQQTHYCCDHKKRRRHGSSRRKKHYKNIQKKKKAQKAESSRSGESLSESNGRKNEGAHEACDKSDANEEDDIEMEITDEMAQFIKTSMMHKLERDNIKKNGEETKEEETSIKIASCQPNPTTSAPKERPGARRAAELKDLYGAGAAMIHGMETALQMTYDRNLDRLKPKLWPNVPLKIVFS